MNYNTLYKYKYSIYKAFSSGSAAGCTSMGRTWSGLWAWCGRSPETVLWYTQTQRGNTEKTRTSMNSHKAYDFMYLHSIRLKCSILGVTVVLFWDLNQKDKTPCLNFSYHETYWKENECNRYFVTNFSKMGDGTLFPSVLNCTCLCLYCIKCVKYLTED